ncbi:MAG: DnaJ domain-containing protein [Bacilli bacterium]|nr:DnaJ domain-containing protein [Bacilli bacterium]
MEQPREPMTLTKALTILGLKEGFSENDLKKAYWPLARKYHPDNYMQSSEKEQKDAEEKMKEVNEAHEFLDKLLKGNDINVYRAVVLEKINSYWQNIVVDDEELINGIEVLASIYGNFLNVCAQKNEIDEVFEQFLENLKKYYETYLKSFYEANYINEADVKEKIDYNCSGKDFYNLLSRIKEKYSRKDIFKKRVDDECFKYQFYATYNARIKALIGAVKDNIWF